MNMIFLCSYLQKLHFISLFYLYTDSLNCFIYFFCYYYFPVFCWTHYMIDQY